MITQLTPLESSNSSSLHNTMPPPSPQTEQDNRDEQEALPFLQGPIDIRSITLTGIFVILLFAVLRVTRDLFLPIILAFLLSFLLAPIIRKLARFHIPEALGATAVFLVVLGTVSFGIYRLSTPATEWLAKAPQSVQQIENKLRRLLRPIAVVKEVTEETTEEVGKLAGMVAKEGAQTVELEQPGLGQIVLTETQEFMVGFLIMFILLYFLLASGDLFLEKMVSILPRLKDKKLAVQIVRQIEGDISTYLFTISSINAGLGVAIGFTMYLLGMPNPFLWGVMGGLLNFIPYFGAFVGLIAVTLAASLTFDTLSSLLAAPTSYFILTNLEAYLVTPMLLGQRLELNRVAIFVWLILWGWLWGAPGMLISVPLLAVIKIICDRLEPLTPIGQFLGQ